MPHSNFPCRMLAKLERHSHLTEADKHALQMLPWGERTVHSARYIVREGAPFEVCTYLLEGFAFRQKITADGGRQIVSIHMPGDFFDLEAALLDIADHNVQALTRCRIATVPAYRLVELIETHPRLARALWADTLIETSICQEWITNVGRREAKQRLGHLICEMGLRFQIAGLGAASSFEVPLSQEQLADATGLTPVHVNRSLKALEADGLLMRHKRIVTIPDLQRLQDFSGFNPLYLHVNMTMQQTPLNDRDARAGAE